MSTNKSRYEESWNDMMRRSRTRSRSPDEIVDRPRKGREIKIDIFEEQNEKKFDKLTKEEKLISPFKRRLSSEKTDTRLSNSDLKRTKTDLDADDKYDEDIPYKVESQRSRQESFSSNSTGRTAKPSKETETDMATLSRREKQIEFGKNTIGYDNYIRLVPKESRTRDHPKTPDKHMKYSRRAWDGLIKIWRKGLHVYDAQANENNGENDEGINGVKKELEELVDSE